MKKKNAFVFLEFCSVLLLALPFLVSAETLTYREVEGANTVTHTLAVTPAAPGTRFELESSRAGAATVRQTFLIAADRSTLAWTFSDPGRQMEWQAERRNDAVFLSAMTGSRKVEKKFKLGGLAWNQLFQLGLEPFAVSGGSGMKFYSIGTQGPGEMKMGKFTVSRQGDEQIALAGKDTPTVRLRISLSGLLSIFWHGDYWYRRADGRFLRYRGKNRPGGSVAVSELVEEQL
jgi:hypothetical protein